MSIQDLLKYSIPFTYTHSRINPNKKKSVKPFLTKDSIAKDGEYFKDYIKNNNYIILNRSHDPDFLDLLKYFKNELSENTISKIFHVDVGQFIKKTDKLEIINLFKDMYSYLLKVDPLLITYAGKDNIIKLVYEFKDELKIASKTNYSWIGEIEDGYELLNITNEFKDTFNEIIKTNPTLISFYSSELTVKILNMFKDAFNEGTKNDPYWISYINNSLKTTSIEMFKDAFNKATKNDPNWIRVIPDEDRLKVVELLSDSFNEATKKDPNWIKHITNDYKLKVIEMFKDAFNEGTKKDPTWVRHIQREYKLKVIKMFKDSFKESIFNNVSLLNLDGNDVLKLIDLYDGYFSLDLIKYVPNKLEFLKQHLDKYKKHTGYINYLDTKDIPEAKKLLGLI